MLEKLDDIIQYWLICASMLAMCKHSLMFARLLIKKKNIKIAAMSYKLAYSYYVDLLSLINTGNLVDWNKMVEKYKNA